MAQKQLKRKPRNVYKGPPLRRDSQAMVDKLAQLTPEEVAQLKADFAAALNEWANKHAKPSA